MKNKWFLAGLLVSILLLWPLFSGSYFFHHDDFHVIRVNQMDKCFKDYQIPCRWAPDLGGGFGQPLFNYYAPLPYYFAEIIFLLTGSLTESVKFSFAFSFVGAYIFMYLLGRRLWGDVGGSVSGVLYTVAPYHALDFYVRGSLGEMWGLMLFPVVFYAAVRLFKEANIQNALIFGISIGGLLLAHNLMAFMFFPLLVIFLLVLLRNKSTDYVSLNYMAERVKRKWKVVLLILFSFFVGLAISSFYWLPMIVESSLIHIDASTTGYYGYTEHFKGLKKTVLDRTWGYGISLREFPGAPKEGVSYQIGWVHLVSFFAVATLSFIRRRYIGQAFLIILFGVLAALFSIYMIHPKSQWIWDLIGPLKFLQYPWRFLAVVIFLISMVSGSIVALVGRMYKGWFAAIVIFLAVILNFSYFRPERTVSLKDADYLSGEKYKEQTMRASYEFLPLFAEVSPGQPLSPDYQVLTGDVKVHNFQKGSHWMSMDLDVGKHAIIRLPQRYFPNWQVLDNGQPIKFEYKNNNLGLITVILGEGRHNLEARLLDTPVRTIGNILTLIGLVTSFVLVLAQSVKIRKWIMYYVKGIR